ncbi:MAG: protoporphyrinogen oxidase [Actinomycetota bacterium]
MPTPEGHVSIVGGGITGLATAWYLRQYAPGLAVTVWDASDRLGGKLRTGSLDGVAVEAGPDTFLARVPWAVELCRALGLEDELVAPATGRAYIWTRGRLRPIPEGTVLGVPARLDPLARSGIVSPAGLARAALDLVLPTSGPAAGGVAGADRSVADVVGGRLGREVVDRLVDPLIGGIHAGRADRLSLAAVAPQVAGPAAHGGSLMRALRGSLPPPTPTPAARAGPEGYGTPGGPLFLGLRGGIERLVERLVERLGGPELRLGAPVRSLDDLGRGPVVLTVPAFAAAPLIEPRSADAAGELAAITYASVVTVTLAYGEDALASGPLDGSGFLVPRVDGRLITACTWLTSKWPHLAEGRPGLVLLRASAGRAGDDRAMELDDAELVDRVHAELVEAMGLRSAPRSHFLTRWPRAFPQYDVGHQARVARIESALAADAPGVTVAGAAYRGVGIAACIQQARQAALSLAGG